MFYHMDLLSLRRNGKFSKIWLAAVCGNRFKKKFRSRTIEMIQIPSTCDEIINFAATRSLRWEERFSLFLSSQLMYGCVLVFKYQVQIYESQAFEWWKRMARPVLEVLEEPGWAVPDILEAPPVSADVHTLRTVVPNEDYITLREEDIYRNLMQAEDELTFGIIPTEELDRLLLPGELSAQDLFPRMVHAQDTIAEFEPPILPGAEIPLEVLPPIFEPDIPRPLPDMPPPATPTKRRPLTVPEVETPTKRSRMAVTEPSIAVVEPSSAAIEPPVPEPTLTSELELDSVDTSALERSVVRRRRKRRLVLDAEFIISNEEFKNAVGTTNIHTKTKKQNRVNLHLQVKASSLLALPSTSRWQSLRRTHNLEVQTWVEPLLELWEESIPSADQLAMMPAEKARAPDTTGEQSGLSEDMTRRRQTMGDESAERSRTLETVPMEIGVGQAALLQPTLTDIGEVTYVETDVSLLRLPEIPPLEGLEEGPVVGREITEGFVEPAAATDDLNEFLPSGRPVEGPREEPAALEKASSSASLSRSVTSQWVSKADVMAQIEVLWTHLKHLTFRRLCKPEDNTRLDAAACFEFCLVLHKEKRIVMEQSGPYRNIYLVKPGPRI